MNLIDSLRGLLHLYQFVPFYFFLFNHTAPSEIYTLSLHDALPIYLFTSMDASSSPQTAGGLRITHQGGTRVYADRSEEHTSELQSHSDLVCRLLLEKKKNENKRQADTDHERE